MRPRGRPVSVIVNAYRDDIDGLRAIAVLAVVFFHAGLGFPGGFVGVDVFFVISGYLITSLIVADLDQGRFSLRRFWERRIRRIWPASLAVLIACLAAGSIIMFPADFRALANTAISQVLMLANVRLWQKVDYFAGHAEIDPLLHMWSLAVEEQFYVLFPFVLRLTWRRGSARCGAVLGALAAASLAASVLLLPRHAAAVFYLLPFRGWELLLGALLACFPWRPGGLIRQLLGVAGAGLIAYPCFAYDRGTPFPGLAAVAPCAGAAAIIVAGATDGGAAVPSLVSRALATSWLTMIGRMSYSIYLWHWPLLAFHRYCTSASRTPIAIAVYLGLVLLVSFCSWRWIETPFRTASKPPGRARALAAVGLLSLAVLACGGLITGGAGIPSRFPNETLRLLRHGDCCVAWETKPGAPECTMAIGSPPSGGPGCFLLWGDSHGMAVSPVFDEVAREMGLVGQAALRRGTCPGVFINVDGTPGEDALSDWNKSVLEWIRIHRPRHVILASRWSQFFNPIPDGGMSIGDVPYSPASRRDWPRRQRILREGLMRIVGECEQTGATVWCLLEVPYQVRSVRERVLDAWWSGRGVMEDGATRAEHALRSEPVRDALAGLESSRLRVIDLAEPLFAGGDASRVRSDDTWWYADDDHLAPDGARIALGRVIREILDAVADDCRTQPDSAAP